MQQTKSYWYLLTAFGVATAFVGAACTVNGTSTIDNNAGAAGDETAGTSNAGAAGIAQGGASAGTGGTAGTAGSAGTGDVDPTTVPACDVGAGGGSAGSPPTGTPASTCVFGVTDDCSTCVRTNCCTELSACFGTSPGNVCGYGGPNNDGEFTCYQQCLQKVFNENGSISTDDRTMCAGSCATNTANMGSLDCGSYLGDTTNVLITCLQDHDCNAACYGS